MMEKKIEILAPAGSYESMKAAVAAGADAVYMGGNRFGARAYADNPDEEKLLEAIDYVHLHGCKIYMTVNTLVKEQELKELCSYLEPFYVGGLDAVIVQDMGVFACIKENFPNLPIHASTQMTITGPLGAKLLMDMGASRIVTARELSLEEITKIHKETGAEIESFVHGALCYCYSGQCLFSSLIGGRSGNRGRCAQTCRLPFEVKREGRTLNNKEERYVLSLKDLCTLDILPDLIEAGVYSMKIEGRMKSPRYTAGVVRIYRKYADLYLSKGRRGYKVNPEDRKQLLELFDRGGQTEGYYKQHNDRSMVALKEKPEFRMENRELYDYLDQTYVEAVLKEPVVGHVTAKEGQPVSLKIEGLNRCITVMGSEVQTAINQPMTEEKIAKQIGKTGNTPFYFENLVVETEGKPFLPVQELNDLRRRGFTELTEVFLKDYRRTLPEIAEHKEQKNYDAANDKSRTVELHVSLEEPSGLPAVLEADEVREIYLDAAVFDAGEWKNTVQRCHKNGKRCLLTLPHIYRESAAEYFKANKELFLKAGFDGTVVRSWEEIQLMKEWAPKLLMVFDYGIYSMNNMAVQMIHSMVPGTKGRFTLPVELNNRELEKLDGLDRELLVYGHIPVMVTAQCLKKTLERCTKQPEVLYLKDRMGKEFPVKNQCRFCYNTIYNCAPLSLLQEKKLVEHLNPGSLRLNFTIESESEIRTVIRAFAETFLEGKESSLPGEFTRGHFKRGVE
ncbi:MAG: U32 family peptidase [Clostridium sp.]